MNFRQLASAVKRRLASRPAEAPPPQPAGHPTGERVPAEPVMDFRCNLCGVENRSVPRPQVCNRECPTCRACHSSLRMRSIVHALSQELFGRPIVLAEFPRNKEIRGLGMSDWEGYSKQLERRFSYTNTFYDAQPRLDITDVPAEMLGRHEFLISTDVFEHIPWFGLEKAFANSRRLLSPGGVFIFTVPFKKTGETEEHFPRLHDFRIVEEGGQRRLHNTTADGEVEIIDDLVFHGGGGMTLEMRKFSEPDLLRQLAAAGFSRVDVRRDHVPELGIMWPEDGDVPIVARA